MRSIYVHLVAILPAVVSSFTVLSRDIACATASRVKGRSQSFALQFIEGAETEGVSRPFKKDESDTWKNSWIPTSIGGFLPELGKNQQKKNVVHEVNSLPEYKQMVADEKEQLVCVRFYAPWCRACKAIENSYKQLARLYPDVKFVEVPLTQETALLHQGLGIPSLPFGHIYHPEVGLVEEQKISRKHFKAFRDNVLQSYVDGYCLVQYNEDGTNTYG